ncbi:MAG TPA: segregation/condensation protein A [Myxococcaceae bacterium]|nr:segregation/condensation protein A [Myxococcaceae bacterium]
MSERSGDDQGEATAAQEGFRVALPAFEGPLDLLLHLIREHRLDILDIPIALITAKYLEHLERMREIDLDIAGEFLVMAATLAHLKSRMLLPRTEAPQAADAEGQQIISEETRDPRAELVMRLLNYQKYKAAAEQLGRQDVLGRDVFTRQVRVEQIPIPDDEVGLVEVSVYRLIEALDRLLQEVAPAPQHEVVREQLSLTETLRALASRLYHHGPQEFLQLFEGQAERSRIIITFLALLELVKLKLVRVRQEADSDIIVITPNGDALERFGAGDLEIDDSEYR